MLADRTTMKILATAMKSEAISLVNGGRRPDAETMHIVGRFKDWCVAVLGTGVRSYSSVLSLAQRFLVEHMILIGGCCSTLLPLRSRVSVTHVSRAGFGEIRMHDPLRIEGVVTTFGRIVTVDTFQRSAPDADRVLREFKALALDMESYWVALACKAMDIPLKIVRVVTDPCSSTEPIDISDEVLHIANML